MISLDIGGHLKSAQLSGVRCKRVRKVYAEKVALVSATLSNPVRIPYLNAKAIRELEPAPPHGSYYAMEWSDHRAVRGFGVRVYEQGKVYVVRFRGKPHTIAPVNVISPERAREEARKYLQALRGLQPDATEQGRVSVEVFLNSYLEDYSRLNKAEHSYQKEKGLAKNHILPARVRLMPMTTGTEGRARFGDLDVAIVRPHHIQDIKLAMTDKRTSFNRCRSLLSHAFNLAERDVWGSLREPGTNPVKAVEPYDESARERAFSSTEWKAIGKWLREAREANLFSPAPYWALVAIAYTGSRPGEVVDWELSWLDHDRKAVQRPTSKSARRGQRRKAKTVWLPPDLFENLLSEIPRGAGEQFVFPARKGHIHANRVRNVFNAMKAAIGAGDDVVPTTFRHSFDTELPEAGVPESYHEDLTGHGLEIS